MTQLENGETSASQLSLDHLELNGYSVTDKPLFNKTMKVYVIDCDTTEIEEHLSKITDDQFMDESEKQGLVYSLDGFQKAFNDEIINTSIHFIRFI